MSFRPQYELISSYGKPHSLPNSLESLLERPSRKQSSRASSASSSSATSLDLLKEILHTPPSIPIGTNDYIEQLFSSIKSSQTEIDPVLFNKLFTELTTEEIFQILETEIIAQDRPPVYFGQPGTMSLAQMQKYFEWMSSVLIQNNESQAARVLNLLKLAGQSGITLLTPYIIEQNQEELTNAYLALLTFLFRCLPPAFMVSFVKGELMKKGADFFSADKEAVYFFVKLLRSITRYPSFYDPEISNLILKNALPVDDVFIKMLKNSKYNKNAKEILCILENTADAHFFHEFLQQCTQEKELYIKEIQAQLPMFLYNHLFSLKTNEDIVSFAKIVGVSDIISTLVCNEIDGERDPKERKEKIQFLSCQETRLFHFFNAAGKLEEIKQKVNKRYLDMAVSALTGHLDINVAFKAVVKKIWDGHFNIDNVKECLDLTKSISTEKKTDPILFHSVLEMVNDRVFGKYALNKDLNFYYKKLSSLFKNPILTASQVANLITHSDHARSSTDSYCQLALSLMTKSKEAEMGLKFSGLHEPMLKYIEQLELEEKVKALETLFDRKSPLFTFFAEASREVQLKIEWMKKFADRGYQEDQRKPKPNPYVLFSNRALTSSSASLTSTLR